MQHTARMRMHDACVYRALYVFVRTPSREVHIMSGQRQEASSDGALALTDRPVAETLQRPVRSCGL